MRALALAMVVASACTIDHHLVPCGELTCPTGLVCTRGGACASAEAAAACAALDDGQPCTTVDISTGTCTDGACYPVACGNHVVDAGEACDDGNFIYNDGCSADCLSNETCGNAFTDPLAGEECDSSTSGLSADGCTSRCSFEFELWRDVSPEAPLGRSGMMMAFDPRAMRRAAGTSCAIRSRTT